MRRVQRKRGQHIQLLARVHPRTGLHLRRWGPHVARQIDLLVNFGLVDWHFGADHPRGSMHITLTEKGKRRYWAARKAA